MLILKARNIQKIFNRNKKNVVLNELNLNIERNSVFGLIGVNGAGKTTLLKLFINLIKPTKGEIKIFGKDVSNHLIREHIGYLPETYTLPGNMTPLEFIKQCSILYKSKRALENSSYQDLFDLVNLSIPKKTKIKNLSKGMLQKVAIAQSLINNPSLLLFDEPTGGLDPVSRVEFQKMIIRLKEEGKTILISSHILSDIKALCDSVGIIKNGKIYDFSKNISLISDENIYKVLSE